MRADSFKEFRIVDILGREFAFSRQDWAYLIREPIHVSGVKGEPVMFWKIQRKLWIRDYIDCDNCESIQSWKSKFARLEFIPLFFRIRGDLLLILFRPNRILRRTILNSHEEWGITKQQCQGYENVSKRVEEEEADYENARPPPPLKKDWNRALFFDIRAMSGLMNDEEIRYHES